jgi:hypothetical protein
MRAYQTPVHLPVAIPHASVLIRATTRVDTSAHAICGLIVKNLSSIAALHQPLKFRNERVEAILNNTTLIRREQSAIEMIHVESDQCL